MSATTSRRSILRGFLALPVAARFAVFEKPKTTVNVFIGGIFVGGFYTLASAMAAVPKDIKDPRDVFVFVEAGHHEKMDRIVINGPIGTRVAWAATHA